MFKFCSRCGKEFYSPSFKPKQVKYCDSCRVEVHREQARASRERLKENEHAIRYKPVKRVCEVCGKEYEGFPTSKYCAECSIKVRREQSTQRYRRPKQEKPEPPALNKPEKTLDDWLREARACNLDYGSYRSLVEKGGMTFEEIKALDLRPVCHSHCRAARKMI